KMPLEVCQGGGDLHHDHRTVTHVGVTVHIPIVDAGHAHGRLERGFRNFDRAPDLAGLRQGHGRCVTLDRAEGATAEQEDDRTAPEGEMETEVADPGPEVHPCSSLMNHRRKRPCRTEGDPGVLGATGSRGAASPRSWTGSSCGGSSCASACVIGPYICSSP